MLLLAPQVIARPVSGTGCIKDNRRVPLFFYILKLAFRRVIHRSGTPPLSLFSPIWITFPVSYRGASIGLRPPPHPHPSVAWLDLRHRTTWMTRDWDRGNRLTWRGRVGQLERRLWTAGEVTWLYQRPENISAGTSSTASAGRSVSDDPQPLGIYLNCWTSIGKYSMEFCESLSDRKGRLEMAMNCF